MIDEPRRQHYICQIALYRWLITGHISIADFVVSIIACMMHYCLPTWNLRLDAAACKHMSPLESSSNSKIVTTCGNALLTITHQLAALVPRIVRAPRVWSMCNVNAHMGTMAHSRTRTHHGVAFQAFVLVHQAIQSGIRLDLSCSQPRCTHPYYAR